MRYESIISIEDVLVSSEILNEYFACNLSLCSGQCCIVGESGAPLDEEEIALLRDEYNNYAPYMTFIGREAVNKQGVAIIDGDGDWVTPLVKEEGECAYCRPSASLCSCAIEYAFFQGKTSIRKPISCWLYPIRVVKLSASWALNYHKWRPCTSAREYGLAKGILLYRFLKDPLIAKFGEVFYKELESIAGEKHYG